MSEPGNWQEIFFRVIFTGCLLGALATSVVFRHRAGRVERIARHKEKPLLAITRLTVALPLFAMLLLTAVNPVAIAFLTMPMPIWIRWTGVIIALGCLPLIWWMFRSIGNNISETVLTKQSHQLVTGGPYAWIRHPLYTFGSLLFAALGIISANPILIILAVIGLILVRLYVIPMEEKNLLAKFGGAYKDYMEATGCLIPRFQQVRQLMSAS